MFIKKIVTYDFLDFSISVRNAYEYGCITFSGICIKELICYKIKYFQHFLSSIFNSLQEFQIPGTIVFKTTEIDFMKNQIMAYLTVFCQYFGG